MRIIVPLLDHDSAVCDVKAFPFRFWVLPKSDFVKVREGQEIVVRSPGVEGLLPVEFPELKIDFPFSLIDQPKKSAPIVANHTAEELVPAFVEGAVPLFPVHLPKSAVGVGQDGLEKALGWTAYALQDSVDDARQLGLYEFGQPKTLLNGRGDCLVFWRS
jgi:hypothetical protein